MSWFYQSLVGHSRPMSVLPAAQCMVLHFLFLWQCLFFIVTIWPVVKLGSPSSIGRSDAEVAFPFSDPSPALQVLSNTVGSSPAAGLAVINEQMACSPFSDLAKHIPFTFFLHDFELFFVMLGESRVAADAAQVNTEE